MSKNIVFIIDIKKDGKVKREYQISIDSWKHFCDKYDHQLVTMEDPVVDMNYMSPIWQRYYLFDILDYNEINFDQICIVDADTIIHPDTPNFFKDTQHKYTLVHDDGNFDWIIRSMENYQKHLFKEDQIFNWYEYFNSGFQIVNKKHREFFNFMKEFYIKNSDMLSWCQKTYGVGTDQTPLNYLLRSQKIDVKAFPYSFNMSCMWAKECVNEEMLHTKAGFVMHFNGLPDKDVTVPYWMEKTYKYLYEN
jgi:hypothetical protein